MSIFLEYIQILGKPKSLECHFHSFSYSLFECHQMVQFVQGDLVNGYHRNGHHDAKKKR